MNMCRSWLMAVHANAPKKAVEKFRGAAVLGDKYGYVVELKDGTQIEVGRDHCKYCARAEALMKLSWNDAAPSEQIAQAR